MEQQYLNLGKRILNEGKMIHNERTNNGCLTVINDVFHYDVSGDRLPLVTTRKANWKIAIAELLGYIRGYDNAQDFKEIGTSTWFANANETPAWLANKNRKGENDLGRVYGVQGRSWRKPNGETYDQLKKIYDNLKAGKDDRGEILMYHNPGELDLGCLRACMYSHHFSLLDGELYLHSVQRSVDVPLGLVANQVQVWVFLKIMAQITGNKAASAMHSLVNCHIYENQIPGMREQVQREPLPMPTLKINPDIKTLEDLETWVTLDDFIVEGYESHPAIKYPFAA